MNTLVEIILVIIINFVCYCQLYNKTEPGELETISTSSAFKDVFRSIRENPDIESGNQATNRVYTIQKDNNRKFLIRILNILVTLKSNSKRNTSLMEQILLSGTMLWTQFGIISLIW